MSLTSITPYSAENYPQSITISEGSHIKSKNWVPTTLPLADLIAKLSDHRVGRKEGSCLVLGDMARGQRKKTSIKTLTCVGLDFDTGTPSALIDQAVAKTGCLAVRYTTQSHGKTETLIKKDEVVAFAQGKEIDTALIRAFVRAEREWHEDMVSSAEYIETRHVTEGIVVAVSHLPFPKNRLVFPLAEPFVIADVAETQGEAMNRWAKVPVAMAKLLDLPLDKSCTDPSRAFYYARHDEGRPYEVKTFGGPCFDWHSLELDDPAELIARELNRGKSKSITSGGKALGGWCSKYGEGLLIADVIDDLCHEKIRGSAGVGYNIECPFDGNHSNAGDPGDSACMVLNAGDGAGEIFHIKCLHEGCRDKTMLDMVGKMLEDKWFSEEVLMDGQYNTLIVEGDPKTPFQEKYIFDSRDELVKAINEHYCIVKIGSSTRFIDETDDELKFLTKQAISDWLAPYKLEVDGKDENSTKLLSGFSAWMCSPNRRRYSSVVFNPRPNVPEQHYNLWKGFAIEPCKGDWSLMKAHLYDIICDGDYDNFVWLMSWLAQLLQEPWDEQGSAVVLRSPGKGTGKSTLGDYMAKILGKHAVTVAQGNHLVGQFNAHIESALLVVGEESYWAGDKGSEGVLKHLITGRTHRIERKGVDSFEVGNFTRLMLLTNSDWAVPAGPDERRFFVLDVSEAMKQNVDYFKALHRELQGGGPAALLYDLLRFDFRVVDLRNPPKTGGLAKQIVATFERDLRWWHDSLLDGAFSDRDGGDTEWSLDEPLTIGRDVLFRSYQSQVKTNYGKPPTQASLGMFLTTVIKEYNIQGPRKSGETRQRQYKLPPLTRAREMFTELKGVRFGADDRKGTNKSSSEADTFYHQLVRDFALFPFDEEDLDGDGEE